TTLRVVDWSGLQQIVSRVGTNFSITKVSPSSTDQPCPADPNTGITPGTNFSSCRSYFAKEVPYTYQGQPYKMSLSSLPVFTSPTTVYFNWDSNSIQDVP